MKNYLLLYFLYLFVSLFCVACSEPLNNPYTPELVQQKALLTAFTNRPKHFDPALAYDADSTLIIGQIYDSPLEYNYIKRPLELKANTLTDLPKIQYFDSNGNEIKTNIDNAKIAESVYTFSLKKGLYFQPHPCFSKDENGDYKYIKKNNENLVENRYSINDFDYKNEDSREVIADDFILAIKRLANPKNPSPILAMMQERIDGLKEFAELLKKENTAKNNANSNANSNDDINAELDYRKYNISGVTKIDNYTWQIKIKGKYPQFLYWQTMPFFAAIPYEAIMFYSQPKMAKHNLTLDWFPVGSGAFMITENNPNKRIVLSKNPHYHKKQDTFPCDEENNFYHMYNLSDSEKAKLHQYCGKTLPLLDKVIFTREKESIPYWNRFLQGYYDASGIASDNFDSAVQISINGDVSVSKNLQNKNISLNTISRDITYYLGFNMLDKTVGGYSEKQQALRHAVGIALNTEEYIEIFLNGRGLVAQSPISPNLFGYDENDYNTFIYDVKTKQRNSIEIAKKLLVKAGYPNGRHYKTHEPLILYLDTTSSGIGDKSRLDWITKQLAKIDIQLVVRATDFNRLLEKLDKGSAQMFYLGWSADYPDAENFLFLFDSKNSIVQFGGDNRTNYNSPKFEEYYYALRDMNNTPQRLELIKKAKYQLQKDLPITFMFHPTDYILRHSWLQNYFPNGIMHNTYKFYDINPQERFAAQKAWN